ncbi:nuclear transport factor 2 family protein [Novosphingobium sp. ZN18A2]|uniref:nuclear transport factor 2 family protein n=1 Tax=Novosphingobium sp. ZN18A2 TaxID=3079861 RepID=UPI0030D4E55A
MRLLVLSLLAALVLPQAARAAECTLTPKQVVTRFMTQFYIDKDVRGAFETWVDPGYIQHNPMAKTGRDAAIAFLEPFFARNPQIHYDIKRVIADGNLVAVHSHGVFRKDDPGIAVVDILRVEGCKVMEHWDVVQPVPAKSANDNTMF